MNISAIKILAPLLFFFFHFSHPVHISTTEILFNSKESRLECTHRFFIDDIEMTIGIDEQNIKFDSIFSLYLNKNFQVSLNGHNTKIKYLGHEPEEDIIWVYQYVNTNIDTINSIKIQNACILDQYSDQKNIVNIKILELKKSFLLEEGNTSESLEIKEDD